MSLVDATVTPPVNTGSTPSDGTKVPFAHYRYSFTADSDTTTIQFSDLGLGNANADQVLDNVIVTTSP